MKKLIAVSVALVLVAGSAFADVTWGGEAQVGVRLAHGSNDDDSDVVGYLRSAGVGLSASATRETNVGTFGGFGELWGDLSDDSLDVTAVVWWEPISMLRIVAGNDVGWLNGIGRAGDNFNRNGVGVGDRWIPDAVGAGVGFMGGVGTGLAFNLTPMDMVNFGVALPYNFDEEEVGDIMQGFRAMLRVNLDVGRIGFGYVGSADDGDNGTIFASFHSSTLVDGLAMNLGVGFALVEDDQRLNVSAGVGWGAAEQFGVGFRAAAQIGLGDVDTVRMGFEAIPRFNITPDVGFVLPVGVGVDMIGDDDAVIRFVVDPYVRVNLGNPSFWAGVQIWGNNAGDDMTVNWAVPIGMRINF